MTDNVDLGFLARQNERILSELAGMRDSMMQLRHNEERLHDDIGVLTAMVVRLEHAQGHVRTEIQSIYAQISRINAKMNASEHV
jgi:hypothetical protein